MTRHTDKRWLMPEDRPDPDRSILTANERVLLRHAAYMDEALAERDATIARLTSSLSEIAGSAGMTLLRYHDCGLYSEGAHDAFNQLAAVASEALAQTDVGEVADHG